MKKNIFKMLSIIILLTCFTNTFANVRVVSHTTGIDTTKLYRGKILNVLYNRPSEISVQLFDGNQSLSVEFDDVDLLVGAGFLSMAGKTLYVSFSDSNFTISRLAVNAFDVK